MKLVVNEEASTALHAYVRGPLRGVSCALARVEVPLAARTHGLEALERARQLVAQLDLVRLDDALLDAAASLSVPGLRSLDAIHIAAALTLRSSGLAAVVTYDERMARAAVQVGLEVAAPR